MTYEDVENFAVGKFGPNGHRVRFDYLTAHLMSDGCIINLIDLYRMLDKSPVYYKRNYIYTLRTLDNRLFYIGQTKDPDFRLITHNKLCKRLNKLYKQYINFEYNLCIEAEYEDDSECFSDEKLFIHSAIDNGYTLINEDVYTKDETIILKHLEQQERLFFHVWQKPNIEQLHEWYKYRDSVIIKLFRIYDKIDKEFNKYIREYIKQIE